MASPKAMAMTKEHLPEDIIVQILYRLPVKPLVRFRCVSKRWSSITSDAQFVKSHFKFACERKTLSHRLLLSNRGQLKSMSNQLPQLESLNLESQSFGDRSAANKVSLPFRMGEYPLTLIGSCNGLVCIRNYKYYIWNPTTGKLRELPDPGFPAEEYYLLHHGLGFVAESESQSDYKLFLAADFGDSPYDPVVEVFSFATQSWKPKLCPCGETVESQGVFLNEKLHWITDDYNLSEHMKPIFAFDVRTDEFSCRLTLPFPKVEFADMGSFSVALFTCEGCLCVWRYGLYAGSASVDFWVMSEYGNCDSWTLRHTFTISNQPERIQFLRPLFVTQTTKVLVRCSYDMKLELVRIDDQAEEIVTYMHGWEDARARGCRMILYDVTQLWYQVVKAEKSNKKAGRKVKKAEPSTKASQSSNEV